MMDFVKKGVISSKYLSDDCVFKKNDDKYKLISTDNDKYTPFIDETYSEKIWDMISSSDITHGEKFDNYYSLLVDHLKSGHTVFDKSADILLKKDEKIIYVSFDNVRLNEAKSIRVTNSAHYGTRHRHGNSSYGIGVSKSIGESFEEIRNIDTGRIIITNKRFIFSGSKRSIDVNISQITGITAYSDGIKLQRKNKQKAEYFVGIDNALYVRVFNNESYFFKMDGTLIKAMVEGGLNKTPQKSKLMIAKSQLSTKKQIESKTKETSKTIINLDSEFHNVKMDLSDDWERKKPLNKTIDVEFQKNIDSNICILNISTAKIPDDLKVFEGKLLDMVQKSNEILSYGHKIINKVDMFICTFLNETNENIVTYFNDGDIQYRVFLFHKQGSSAKSDYYDMLNSVQIIEKKDDSSDNSSAMFCPACGVTISPDSNFCVECGTKINHDK